MSELYKEIKSDIIKSMKTKNGETILLRSLDSAIQLKILNSKMSEITNDIVIDVLEKAVKQRLESIEAFEKGNRNDLVQKEKIELEILKRYFPMQLTNEEVVKIIENAIVEANALSIKDMGKLMPIVMKYTKGRADSKKISELVRQKLS